MKTKIILDSDLMERRDLRSGRIYREGSSPEYGVIFTSHVLKTEDDLGLDPNVLFGAFIGHKQLPESDRQKIFEILGGYFYHDNYPDIGITTKVFGFALEPEFGVIEGGAATLNDKWKLKDPEKPILDESYWSKKYGPHHGWTFIVTLKEREKYPRSEDRLKIFSYCPEIKELSAEIGECEFDPQDNKLKRHVSFTTIIGEDKPKNWIWHFGDGDSKSGTGSPPETIDHFYAIRPENTPKLCLQGHNACDQTCHEVGLTGFETCPQCPEIKDITSTYGVCKTEGEIRRRRVAFTAKIDGDKPDHWTFNFGDGEAESGDGMPPAKIEHFYEKKPEVAPKLCVIGPGVCGESCKEADLSNFEECLPCPKITLIEHTISDKDENTKTVTFSVNYSGRKPDIFEWDWGDGSPRETTTESTISHDYAMQTSGSVNYDVSVISMGPEDCTDTQQITIEIPEKIICPQIKDLQLTFGECKTEGEIRRRKVTFASTVEGNSPDSWIWHFGDGKTEPGDGAPPATIDHFFDTKPENFPKLCIVGPDPCGETCREVDMSDFEECLPCPVITGIEYTISDKDENTKTVTFTTVIDGRKPNEFEWDWGDGSPKEKTTEPTGAHDYQIPESGTAEFVVSITSGGPEDCHSSAQTTIEISSKPKVHNFCFFMPLIVSFLTAITFGTLLCYFVGKLFIPEHDFQWLLFLILPFGFLTFISIMIWFSMIKREICPKPHQCVWLGMGWIVLLAGMWVALYLQSCCAAWWWIFIVILASTGGYLIFKWIKECAVNFRIFIFHFITWLLASASVCYFVGSKVLEICSH